MFKCPCREETSPKCKHSHYLYSCEPDEEEVMAVMCYNGETYNGIQPNGIEEANYKQ